MASITFRPDNRWNKPALTLPGSERWGLIDRHYVKKGLLAELAGQQMMFLDTANYWIPLVSKTAALRISQVMGNDNASVNYSTSFEPYYNKMSKACGANSFTFVPVSTCIGTERLTIELDRVSRTLRFDVVAPYDVAHIGKMPAFIHGLCFQPTDHITIPQSYTFPGVGTVIEFIRPLFPDVRSMITYMWIIGNAARDPVSRPRCLMLCGPGGSGKSTALRMATGAMQGVTNLIPDNILTRDHPSLGDKVAQTVIKSRLVTCYELDLDKYEVNMSMFKNITGSDYVKVGEFMAKAVCSFAIATNGIPDMSKQPEFTDDSISRRLVCVKMNVDTAEAPYQPDPTRDIDKMDFHCACLYIRMCYQDIPISPDCMLLTLCLSRYHLALKYIDVECEGYVSPIDGRAVVSTIAALLDTEEYRVIERCRLISMSSISMTPLGEVIKEMSFQEEIKPPTTVDSGEEVEVEEYTDEEVELEDDDGDADEEVAKPPFSSPATDSSKKGKGTPKGRVEATEQVKNAPMESPESMKKKAVAKFSPDKNPFPTHGAWNKEALSQITISFPVLTGKNETTNDLTREKRPEARFWKAPIAFRYENFTSETLRFENVHIPFHTGKGYGETFVYLMLPIEAADAFASAGKEVAPTKVVEPSLVPDRARWWKIANKVEGLFGVINTTTKKFQSKSLSTIFDATQSGISCSVVLRFYCKASTEAKEPLRPVTPRTVAVEMVRGFINQTDINVQLPTKISRQRVKIEPTAKSTDVASDSLMERLAQLGL